MGRPDAYYGQENFYGHMSLLSAISGFCLALGVVATTAHRGMLAAILSPYISGKVARAQILAGILVPMVAGYLLLLKLAANGSTPLQGLLSLLVVLVCLFIFLMIGISAIFQERIDFARRQSEAQLKAMSETDPLTGLANRRKFFEMGLRERERIKRHDGELWVLMLDIDHFKNINDTAGHGMGDKVLVALADMLTKSIRKTDVIGRLGGEEFAVILTGTNQDGCTRVAEDIRKNIESTNIPDWTKTHGPTTVSIGCAKLRAKDSLDGTLFRADEALYRAKKSGRNQVCFSNAPDEIDENKSEITTPTSGGTINGPERSS